MTHRLQPFVLSIVLLLVAGSAAAQSVSLPFFRSGPVIGVQSSFSGGDGYGLSSGAGYSIAGVLDLGIRFGADVVASEEAVTSDVGMYYGFALLKQSEGVPLSAQISGAYTFRAESSDFLTRNELIHEARGYSLAIALVRDWFFGPTMGVRIGGLAEYENYLQSITVGFDATDSSGTAEVVYTDYPRVERLSGFAYGTYLGLMVRTRSGGGLLVGSSVLLSPTPGVEFRPDVQLLMSR